MGKCAYCNREVVGPVPTSVGEGTVLTCCCDDCKGRTLAFYRNFEKYKSLFIIGIILSVVLIFVGVFVNAFTGSVFLLAVFFASGLAALGLICLLFPFATPETFSLLGIKKTVLAVRVMGVVIILASPLVAFFVMS